jgi:hypothetical protein
MKLAEALVPGFRVCLMLLGFARLCLYRREPQADESWQIISCHAETVIDGTLF